MSAELWRGKRSERINMNPNSMKAALSASPVSLDSESRPTHATSSATTTSSLTEHADAENIFERREDFDPITGEVIESTNGQRSLFDLPTRELEQLTQLKRGSSKVAVSLAHSTDLDQVTTAAKIASCAQRIRLKDGRWMALNRCRSKVCAHCSNITSAKMTARLKSAMGYLGYAMKDEAHRDTAPHRLAIGLKVTLNAGESCSLDELRERLEILHDCFPRLCRITALKDQIVGYVRSTETVQSSNVDGLRCHPHIHALLLLRADSDIEKISKAIMRYWLRKMGTEHAKIGKLINVSASVKRSDIIELRSHTAADLLSWCRYATKGSYDLIGLSSHSGSQREAVQATAPDFWSAVEAATKRIRLISLGGELRRAAAEAQAEHERSERAKRRLEAVGPVPDVARDEDRVYSVASGQYVRAADHERWVEDAALSHRLSYAHPAPHFASLFQREYIAMMERAEAAHRLTLLHMLSAPEAPIPPRLKRASRELSDINTRKVRADYHEASEVEREPPQHGSPVAPSSSAPPATAQSAEPPSPPRETKPPITHRESLTIVSGTRGRVSGNSLAVVARRSDEVEP